jgi:ketosteroid isomerase-like protein
LNKIERGKKVAGQLLAACVLMQFGATAHAGLFSDSRVEIKRFEQDLNSAVGRNDVQTLERYLSDDWSIVSGEGSVITRSTFLQVMASGDLVHQSMDPQDQTIRLYGNVAVVTAHIQSGGSYKGNSFHTDEIGTDVIVKRHGHWVCVLTQLTTVTAR